MCSCRTNMQTTNKKDAPLLETEPDDGPPRSWRKQTINNTIKNNRLDIT